ncbi:blastula protease 10-like [Haliotis cracherodii]|uniref:blastula protease 10-like n=1 Tax=Haliotis cracherodii TaxID=6455 RepID=UPI0039EA4DF4
MDTCMTLLFLVCFVSATLGAPRYNQPLNVRDPLARLQLRSSHGLPKPDEELDVDSPEFEFDMVLTPLQRLYIATHSGETEPSEAWKRKAIVDVTRHWPQATVPYQITSGLKQYQIQWAIDAMSLWENSTCIRFYPRSALLASQLGHDDYVSFTNGSSCRTMVGRVPGGQDLSVGQCSKGSILHELGHTIGYVHEQSRPDRDANVDIIENNIIPTRESDFKKYTSKLVRTFGLPYDYGSIMHYSSTAFSKNGGLTVRTHDPHLQMIIGQRKDLSFLDVQLANDLYKCNDHCTTHKICNNNGYVGPDCTCVCPEGLTGDTCDQLMASDKNCGGVLNATSGSLQTPDYPMDYPQNADCYWLIQGPPRSNIVLTFDAFDTDNELDCQWCACDYLEVKVYGLNKVGQRYCGTYVKNPIVYNSSSLLLHFHSDEIWTMNSGVKFSYKIVTS